MRKIAQFVLVAGLILPAFANAGTLININTASAVQLETLPGIGPSKAAAIVDYRTLHGPFVRTEDIQRVKGVGPSTYVGFASLITVGEVQPSARLLGFNSEQTVGTAPVINTSQPAHENASVRAPGTTSELALPGAFVTEGVAVSSEASSGNILYSRWTLVFLMLLMLAGGLLMIV